MSAVGFEVVEHPLDTEALSRRWREILDDPRFANFAGKIDLDRWGRMIVTPVNTEHAGVAGRLARLLEQQLGGRALIEAGVRTADGVFAPDVLCCTDSFWEARREQTPLEAAPDICVEGASPSNTMQDLHTKVRAYLEAGAAEAWIVFPRSKRIEFHDRSGKAVASSFPVDLSTLFD
jgi:Uma2 family endonuclease